jgi:hypothetical protein
LGLDLEMVYKTIDVFWEVHRRLNQETNSLLNTAIVTRTV